MSDFNYSKYLNAEIREAERSYDRAAEGLKCVIEQTQETCTHEVVAFDGYRRLEYLRSLTALRMCLQCRLEEHAASVWQEGNKQWSKGILNPNSDRLYVHIDRGKIYGLRLHGSKIIDHRNYED
jgi:hypothetical protein